MANRQSDRNEPTQRRSPLDQSDEQIRGRGDDMGPMDLVEDEDDFEDLDDTDEQDEGRNF